MFGKLFARSPRPVASPSRAAKPAPSASSQASSPAGGAEPEPADRARFDEASALPEGEGREAAFLALALDGARAEWRLKAAGELRTPGSWERLVQDAKERDRGVYRLGKDKLAAHRRRVALEEAVTGLEAALAKLVEAPVIDLARLIDLDRQAAALEGADLGRVRALRARIDARIETERAGQQRLNALREAIRGAQAALGAGEPDLAALAQQADAWASEVEPLAQLPGIPAALARGLRQEHAALVAAIAARQGDEARIARCRALLAEVKALEVASEAQIEKLKHAWMQAAGSTASPRLAELAEQFSQRLSRLRGQIKEVESQRQQARAQIEEQLQAMERALEAGETRAAFAAEEALRQLVPDASVLAPGLQRRLRAGQEAVGKLRGWQRFTAVTHRDELCAMAEKLVGSPLPPEALGREISALQENWKALDHQLGAASHAQWERFHAATARAYEPVRLHREQLAQARAAHAQARRALLDGLKALTTRLAEAPVDWKALARGRSELVPQWFATGPVDRKEAKRLDAEWEAALKTLDQALDAERAREKARRHALIAEVEQRLEAVRAATSDESRALAEAMDFARAAQARWQSEASGVPLKRSVEQALWERFRAACNGIFALREESRKARETQRQAEREAQHAARRAAQEQAVQRRAAARDALVQARARDRERYVDGAPEQTRRAALVLDLEIALGLESPEALKAERMRRQVALLSGSLKGEGRADPLATMKALFALTGAADAELDGRIDRIVQVLAGEARAA